MKQVLPFRVLGGFKYEKKKMVNHGGFLSIIVLMISHYIFWGIITYHQKARVSLSLL